MTPTGGTESWGAACPRMVGGGEQTTVYGRLAISLRSKAVVSTGPAVHVLAALMSIILEVN